MSSTSTWTVSASASTLLRAIPKDIQRPGRRSQDPDNVKGLAICWPPELAPSTDLVELPSTVQRSGSTTTTESTGSTDDDVKPNRKMFQVGGSSESAIEDDDDSSEWEDEKSEQSGFEKTSSQQSAFDGKTSFQRVDLPKVLTSQRSLITLMLEQNDQAGKLGNAVSQSTSASPYTMPTPQDPLVASPNDSDEAPLMKRGLRREAPLKPINEVPRSSTTQPIMVNAPHGQYQYQAALSPRTTRRNMLSTDLTKSLRRHLLWERQQKSLTANAVLKRRHTSHDVANLKQYPEKSCIKKSEDVNASSWDQYFTKEAYSGYHTKGW